MGVHLGGGVGISFWRSTGGRGSEINNTCDFTSFLTVFQSYQGDVWMIMKGCVCNDNPWSRCGGHIFKAYGWCQNSVFIKNVSAAGGKAPQSPSDPPPHYLYIFSIYSFRLRTLSVSIS